MLVTIDDVEVTKLLQAVDYFYSSSEMLGKYNKNWEVSVESILNFSISSLRQLFATIATVASANRQRHVRSIVGCFWCRLW